MEFLKGNNTFDFGKLKLGFVNIDRIYLGSNYVWPPLAELSCAIEGIAQGNIPLFSCAIEGSVQGTIPLFSCAIEGIAQGNTPLFSCAIEGSATASTIPDGTVIIDGIVYNEVTSPYTGRVWLDKNLGATQVASSKSDSDGYGYLYQWGRLTDGHQLRDSTAVYNTQATDYANAGTDFISNASGDWLTPSNNNLWNTLNTEDFPDGYSVPSRAEWEAEEIGIENEFGASNLITWNNSFLKISGAGNRVFDNPSSEGNYGVYWTREASSNANARSLVLYNDTGNMAGGLKSTGKSVRLIKDAT